MDNDANKGFLFARQQPISSQAPISDVDVLKAKIAIAKKHINKADVNIAGGRATVILWKRILETNQARLEEISGEQSDK